MNLRTLAVFVAALATAATVSARQHAPCSGIVVFGMHCVAVPFNEIVAIDEIDRLKNGGAGRPDRRRRPFAADVLVSRADRLYLTGAGYGVFGTIYGGLGLAAGAAIDALIGGDRRIYTRGTTARISVAPTLRPDRACALIGISW